MRVHLNHRMIWLGWVALVLAAVACVCTGGGVVAPTVAPATSVPATPVPPTQTPAVGGDGEGGSKGSTGAGELVIENQSSAEICGLYVGPNGDPDWGENQLDAGDTIAPGSSFTLTDIPPGSYDMRVDTCAGDTAERYAVDITNVFTWTIVDETETGTTPTGNAELIIENNSSQTICYLYVSPNGSPEWGDDQLGADRTIPPNTTFTLEDVPPGVYDLMVTDCNNDSLAERYGVDIQVRFTWTLTD